MLSSAVGTTMMMTMMTEASLEGMGASGFLRLES